MSPNPTATKIWTWRPVSLKFRYFSGPAFSGVKFSLYRKNGEVLSQETSLFFFEISLMETKKVSLNVTLTWKNLISDLFSTHKFTYAI